MLLQNQSHRADLYVMKSSSLAAKVLEAKRMKQAM